MSQRLSRSLNEILALSVEGRVEPLATFAASLVLEIAAGVEVSEDIRNTTVEALVALVEDGAGSPKQRLVLGESLGRLGDPRLKSPADPSYWARVRCEDDQEIEVGRFLVTCADMRRFLDEGWAVDANWSEEGLAWRDSGAQTWDHLASDPGVSHLVVPNQPAVGVNWYEADAAASFFGARLLYHSERKQVVRGAQKRPYPWGAPFGEGNANTREEALGRPCAVGLFIRDRTPDGIYDLAGNAAEWTADRVGGQRIFHPGSWAQPSMAAWAKALQMGDADSRSADLGFRLARDLG